MDQQKIKIAHRVISENHHPFIIAEISANHCGSIKIAKKLIADPKKSGVPLNEKLNISGFKNMMTKR